MQQVLFIANVPCDINDIVHSKQLFMAPEPCNGMLVGVGVFDPISDELF